MNMCKGSEIHAIVYTLLPRKAAQNTKNSIIAQYYFQQHSAGKIIWVLYQAALYYVAALNS